MYLDAFTLSALVDEFMDALVGGRVQDTLAVDPTGVGLEIYANHQRHYLYMNADPLMPRLHLVPDKLRRGVTTPSTLVLLFRRYVEGGGIVHVSQPEWERLVQIDVQGPEGVVSIIVEPMERRSNILLVQNGIILDCMRRVGPEENRYRLSLPQHEYVPPPPQVGKLDPFRLTRESLLGILEQNDDPKRKTQQLLTSRLLGVSPLLAKEALFRAGAPETQKAADADPDTLLAALGTVVEPLQKRDWQPGIAETEAAVTAFSVYPLQCLPGWHRVETVSLALTAFYGAPVGEGAYNAAKVPVREAVHEAQTKLRAKFASLERSLTDDAERETLRHSGELILAYQYTLKKNQTELRAQYDPGQPELVIPLDPDLSPVENAQHYFERYNKAKRALDDVPQLIEETRRELQYLEQLENDLDMARGWSEIDEVRQALQSKGYWRGKTIQRAGSGGQSAPLKLVTQDGYVVWVGRNSRQNEIVTFKHGGGEDLWLHAHGVPGAHVVIRFDGRRIADQVVEKAAAVAAYYSAKRGDSKVLVDVTRCKYVKKIKGAGPGMVTYRNEEPRAVAPHDESILQSKT
jgi:predicted ribosome quality control (RQC) complex YloA/Tae2 family protein